MFDRSLLPHWLFGAFVAILCILSIGWPAHAGIFGPSQEQKEAALAQYLHDYSSPQVDCELALTKLQQDFYEKGFRQYSSPRLSTEFFVKDVLRDVADYKSEGLYRSTDKLKIYRRAYDAGQACGGRSAEDILYLLFNYL